MRAGKIERIIVACRRTGYTSSTMHKSDICLQHLVAMMIVDGGGRTVDSIHDDARMSDPKVLAVRELVEAVPTRNW